MYSLVRFFLLTALAVSSVSAFAARGAVGGQAEPTEHGTKTVDDLVVTLLTAPPLAPEQMAKFMPGMGEMKGMGPTGRMQQMRPMGPRKEMGPMKGREATEERSTHWIGVIVRDAKTDAVVQNLPIALTAEGIGASQNVSLMPMPGSYGANIALPARGGYRIRVTVSPPGRRPGEVTFDLDYR